jgi:lipopolysaccharide transport system permease protein
MPDEAREEFFGHAHVTEISARGRSLRADLRELWLYRDLLYVLSSRDVSLRYKQTVLGVAWAVLQPVVLMVLFTIVFGRFARLPSEGYPYPLFILCAILPWQYFARSLANSGGSLVASQNMVTKVYFPRLILPISKTVSGLVDLAISFVLLCGAMAWYGIMPGWQILFLPVFVAVAMATALGIGLWLTALNVRYRDIGLVIPFLAQVWMYASPLAYSITLVPERWRWLYCLNPMVGVIEGFRWALLGKPFPDVGPLLLSLLIVLLLFAGGLGYFRRTERTFADVI